MKRLAVIAAGTLSLVLMSAAPALAGSPNGWRHESMTVWATPDSQNNVVIDGSFSVNPTAHGVIQLHLFGLTKSGSWQDTSESASVDVVQGQTVYQFSFNTKWDKYHFHNYKVFSDDGSSSRTINRDECGFRVPEAPSSGLLLLGALPAIGIVGARVAGIRLPRPKWTRIA